MLSVAKYMQAHKNGGYEFVKTFYDLGLRSKYAVLEPILQNLDTKTFNRAVDAILQHSPLQSRKTWPVRFIRKQSHASKLADIEESKNDNRTSSAD